MYENIKCYCGTKAYFLVNNKPACKFCRDKLVKKETEIKWKLLPISLQLMQEDL